MIKQLLQEFCDQSKHPWLRLFKLFFFDPPKAMIIKFRIGQHFFNKKHRLIPRLLKINILTKYSSQISFKAHIGKGISFPHPIGIVIGDGVEVKENCTIYQQVTLGGKKLGDGAKNLYPCIDKNCILFSGSKILGPIQIGESVTIGANAVVLNNCDSNSTYAGIPAKKVS